MTKTQELIQDSEKLIKMRNSIKDTDRHESEKKIWLLEMRLTEATAQNMELLNTVHELLEEQDNLDVFDPDAQVARVILVLLGMYNSKRQCVRT